MSDSPVLYTIGHSNHDEERFVELLKRHSIEVLADVRSQPFSRYSPQFNRDVLSSMLAGQSIQYLFMGDQLGGRPPGDGFLDDEGHVLYFRVAEADFFRQGIARLKQGIQNYRVAIMCSEEDPLVCHRHRLVARVLHEQGTEVQHIRADGRLETYDDVEPAEEQMMLFGEMEHDSWKSLLSVLPKHLPPNSSES